MINWPDELPALQLGSTYSPVDPQLRSQSQSGRTIARRRFSNTPENFSARWVMTSTQAIIFETFYRRALENGVKWFNLPVTLPRGREMRLAKFLGIYSRVRLTAPGVANGSWEYTANMQLYLRAEEIQQ